MKIARITTGGQWDGLRPHLQFQARLRMAEALSGAEDTPEPPPPPRPRPTDRFTWHELIALADERPDTFGATATEEHPALTAAVGKASLWLSRLTSEPRRYAEDRIRAKMSADGVRGHAAVATAVRYLRDFPEDWILRCDNCGYVNEEGWDACGECFHDREGHLDVAAQRKTEAAKRAAQRKADRLRVAFENSQKPNPYTSETNPLDAGPPGGYTP